MNEESGSRIRFLEGVFLALFVALPFRETIAGWTPFAYLALFAVIVGLAVYSLFHREERIRIPLPLVLFVLWVLAATLYASVWDRSFELLGTWIAALLVFLTARDLSRRDSLFGLKLCLALWVTASLISALNLGFKTDPEELARAIEQAPQEADFKEAILHAAAQGRFNSPFGNPIDLGLYLSLSLLAIPSLFDAARTQPRPALMMSALAFTGGIQTYVLWGTKSRTSILALGCGILVWLFLTAGRSKRLLFGAVSVCALGAVLMVASPTGREMLARVETVSARLIYWETASHMIRDHPIFGVGVGGYGDHYPMYRGLTTHQTKFPHNLFIEVLTDLGAVGFALFLWVAFTRRTRAETEFSRYSLQSRPSSTRNSVREGGLRKGSPRIHSPGGPRNPESGKSSPNAWRLAALVAFFLAMQLGFPHNLLYLVGVIAAIAAIPAQSEHTSGRAFALSPRLMAATLLLLSIPIAMREIGKAQFEQARQAFIERRDSPRAQKKLERALACWPPLAQAQHFYASALRDSGQPRLAEERFRRAIYWEPTSAFMREDLAALLWRQGRRDEALEHLDEAIRLHPVKWNYHHRRSLWLLELGDKQGAERERKLAESLKPYEPDYRRARLEQEQEAADP
jgi:O-antigen ligase